MIIYFSATGNCQYVAKKIAKKTDDKTQSIISKTKTNDYIIELEKNESLGIIIPTYFLGLPELVNDFLSKVEIKSEDKKHYIFVVSTFGTTSGYSTKYVQKYIEKQGYTLNARFGLRMPDTWTVNFDLSTKENVKSFNPKLEQDLNVIIEHVINKSEGSFVKLENNRIVAEIAQKVYQRQRRTSKLHVLDSCNSCRLCVKDCPIRAIEMKEDKPVWVKDKCLMCLRCLHRCPKFAIQYADRTQDHGQYTNPHVKIFD